MARLTRHGPLDVHAILCSHRHFDHRGQAMALPGHRLTRVAGAGHDF